MVVPTCLAATLVIGVGVGVGIGGWLGAAVRAVGQARGGRRLAGFQESRLRVGLRVGL